MVGKSNVAARPPQRSRTRRHYLPPQHGAWAMLTVPYAAGVIVAGFAWPDIPLLVAWIAGYLLSYYLFLAVKSRRPQRYRAQIVLYLAVAVPAAALVVASRPAVLLYAPAYAILFGANAWFAWVRRERALLNDIVSVVESCLMVLVVATVADTAPRTVLPAFALCLAYFLGTVFYVKTMIRERKSVTYRRWSIAYHVLALAATAWLGIWAAILFAWLLLRAALLPARALVPKQVGIIEIVNCVLLLGCIVLLA